MFVFLRHRTSVKTLSPQKVIFVLPGENRQFCYQFYCFVVFPFNYSTQRKLDFVFTFNYGWTKNLKVAAKGQDMSELGLTAITVQVDKVGYSVGVWSRCPFP